jgi:hypothetical protein
MSEVVHFTALLFKLKKEVRSANSVDGGQASCALLSRAVVVPSCMGAAVTALGVRPKRARKRDDFCPVAQTLTQLLSS